MCTSRNQIWCILSSFIMIDWMLIQHLFWNWNNEFILWILTIGSENDRDSIALVPLCDLNAKRCAVRSKCNIKYYSPFWYYLDTHTLAHTHTQIHSGSLWNVVGRITYTPRVCVCVWCLFWANFCYRSRSHSLFSLPPPAPAPLPLALSYTPIV